MGWRTDIDGLLELGEKFDAGESMHGFMAQMLRVRDKQGKLEQLFPNSMQQDHASKCGRRNIVLKARQLGMTTYIAARFFVSTVTHRGRLSVQVAHDQRSAEEIFRS